MAAEEFEMGGREVVGLIPVENSYSTSIQRGSSSSLRQMIDDLSSEIARHQC